MRSVIHRWAFVSSPTTLRMETIWRQQLLAALLAHGRGGLLVGGHA